MSYQRKPIEEHKKPGIKPPPFWDRMDRSGGPTACWPWTGELVWGYGKLSVDGRSWRAHRYAWKLSFGDPGEQFVLHRCDNRQCCNPAHLFLGSQADNMADKVAKGRQARGERAGAARLTADDVLAIRSMSGTQEEIAARFGIDRSAVSAIKRRKNWRHL